jgi:hypothetical protein
MTNKLWVALSFSLVAFFPKQSFGQVSCGFVLTEIPRMTKSYHNAARVLPTLNAVDSKIISSTSNTKGYLDLEYERGELTVREPDLSVPALYPLNRDLLGKFNSVTTDFGKSPLPPTMFLGGGAIRTYEPSVSFVRDATLKRNGVVGNTPIVIEVTSKTSAQEYYNPKNVRFGTRAPDKVSYRKVDDLLEINFSAGDKFGFELGDLTELRERFELVKDIVRSKVRFFEAHGFESNYEHGLYFSGYPSAKASIGTTYIRTGLYAQKYSTEVFLAALIDVFNLNSSDFHKLRQSVDHYVRPPRSGQPYIRK